MHGRIIYLLNAAVLDFLSADARVLQVKLGENLFLDSALSIISSINLVILPGIDLFKEIRSL